MKGMKARNIKSEKSDDTAKNGRKAGAFKKMLVTAGLALAVASASVFGGCGKNGQVVKVGSGGPHIRVKEIIVGGV